MQTSAHQPRLHRLHRTFARSPLYFVTLCTYGRAPLLVTDGVHLAFVDFAKRGDFYGVYVGSYVLMPDHAHLFRIDRRGDDDAFSMDEIAEKLAFEALSRARPPLASLAEGILRSRHAVRRFLL